MRTISAISLAMRDLPDPAGPFITFTRDPETAFSIAIRCSSMSVVVVDDDDDEDDVAMFFFVTETH